MKRLRRSVYAIHALVHIANCDGQNVAGAIVAKKLMAPEGFLVRLLVELSRVGILWASKGPNGGYQLARSTDKITILDIIEAVDGPLMSSIGFTSGRNNVDKTLDGLVVKGTDAVRKTLAATTIAALMSHRKRKRGAVK
jgi:Rrf2 family protein